MMNLFKGASGQAGEQIDVQEAARRLDAGAVMLDVREPGEYAGGHAPSARLLPLGLIRAHGSAAVDGLGLPENAADVLLICHSGMRSQMAQGILSADVRRRYVNVAGGMSAWVAHGLPVSQK